MSPRDQLLEDTLDRLLRDHLADCASPRAPWSPDLWAELEQSGLTRVGVPAELGGSGGDLADAVTIARLAGRWQAPVPIADSELVAAATLAAAGAEVPGGPLAVVTVPAAALREGSDGILVRADVADVPWARVAAHIVVVGRVDGELAVALVPAAECEITPGCNLAGEPRDRVHMRDLPVARIARAGTSRTFPTADDVRVRGALARAALMVGALEWTLEATAEHAVIRHQFGQPIAAFQAVQHLVAILAGEVARAAGALDLAVDAAMVVGRPHDASGAIVPPPELEVAVAKIVTGEAATVVSKIAHQVHGAIGYTLEHPLHEATRRLWSWRDEYGDEASWATFLGAAVATAGPERVWPTLTRFPGPRGE